MLVDITLGPSQEKLREENHGSQHRSQPGPKNNAGRRRATFSNSTFIIQSSSPNTLPEPNWPIPATGRSTLFQKPPDIRGIFAVQSAKLPMVE